MQKIAPLVEPIALCAEYWKFFRFWWTNYNERGLTTMNVFPSTLFRHLTGDCKLNVTKSRKYSNDDQKFIVVTCIRNHKNVWLSITHKQSINKITANGQTMLSDLRTLLLNKLDDFENPVFKNMLWIDPKNWSANALYGVDQIEESAKYLKESLPSAKFVFEVAIKELKPLKNFILVNNTGWKAEAIWEFFFDF